MGLSQTIDRKIKLKESEIREVDRQIRDLEMKRGAALAYIQGLKEILPSINNERSPISARENDLRPNSQPYAVREMLLKEKRAMHIDEILAGIGKAGDKKAKLSLASTLARYVRDGEIFNRPAPNTFGLIEEEEPIIGDLPETFGN